jgi:cation:H+ antiporter
MADLIRGFLTGHGVAAPFAAFVLAGVLVFVVASRLARHADAIADATGLGRIWIGAILLAASTSLPELVTDINAAVLDSIDIGIGDLLGSTLANMLIFAVSSLLYARRRILHQVSVDHGLVGALGVALTALAGAAIASGGWGRIGHVGLETLLIVGLYLVGMRTVFVCTRAATTPPEQLRLGDTSASVLRSGLTGFALAALGLLVTAPLLVVSAEAVALESGLSQTFVGTLLVGFTTSFPEMAATFAAVRLGAFDLAIGNVFGSNAFNMCVLLAMDVFYTKGPLLADASPANVLVAQLAALSIALGMLAVLARAGRSASIAQFDSMLIIAVYAGSAWLLAFGSGS